MSWNIFTPQDFQTSHWAGGITTQLAIGPQGAHYADRDFLWRISSAQVALDHSVFTHLPDYHRFLTVLEGELELQIGSGPKLPLPPLSICQFDGGVPVESWGRCKDLNLMLRKGACTGSMEVLRLPAGSSVLPPDWDILGLYCVQGGTSWLRSGELGLPSGAYTLPPGSGRVLCLPGHENPAVVSLLKRMRQTSSRSIGTQ